MFRVTNLKSGKIKRMTLSLVVILILLISMFLITIYSNTQKILFVSTIFLIASFIPFILNFEKGAKRSQELAIIAVYTAITIVLNFLSFSLVPFQAGTAMVIIAGVVLGPQSAFLIGCLSRFIINLFYIQGLWTLWQMLGWGIIGFLAGIVFYKQISSFNENEKGIKGYLKKFIPKKNDIKYIVISLIIILLGLILSLVINRDSIVLNIYVFLSISFLISIFILKNIKETSVLLIAIYSFFATLLFYGGLLNLSTVVMVGGEITKESIALIYIAGFPYDLLHALGATLFILVFSPFIIKVINRIKIKYNLKF